MRELVLFLDANVLAQPVTRTLLIVGSRIEGLVIAWSAHAESEAERHLPAKALSIPTTSWVCTSARMPTVRERNSSPSAPADLRGHLRTFIGCSDGATRV